MSASMRRRRIVGLGGGPLVIGYDVGSEPGSTTAAYRWHMHTGGFAVSAARAGILTSATIHAVAADSGATLCTGTWDGTTFTVNDFETLSISAGRNTYPISLYANKGDVLAVRWSTVTQMGYITLTGVTMYINSSTAVPSAGLAVTGWNNGFNTALCLQARG